ncbi:13621_t:CDS:1, partial [Entrophospora sp. SA101]
MKKKEEYEKEVERLKKEVKSNPKGADNIDFISGNSIDQHNSMEYHDENFKGGRTGK